MGKKKLWLTFFYLNVLVGPHWAKISNLVQIHPWVAEFWYYSGWDETRRKTENIANSVQLELTLAIFCSSLIFKIKNLKSNLVPKMIRLVLWTGFEGSCVFLALLYQFSPRNQVFQIVGSGVCTDHCYYWLSLSLSSLYTYRF